MSRDRLEDDLNFSLNMDKCVFFSFFRAFVCWVGSRRS